MYKLHSASSWPTSNSTVSVGSALTFTITGLTTNTAYDVQVWAVNQFGEGPTDTYTISTSAVPDCPTNVNVTLDSTATEVDVTWTAAVDHNNTITSYTVYFLQSDNLHTVQSQEYVQEHTQVLKLVMEFQSQH